MGNPQSASPSLTGTAFTGQTMPATLIQSPDTLLIKVIDHFDFSLRPELAEAQAICTGAPENLVCQLDLAGVSYLDATALTLIRQLSMQLQSAGTLLSIVNPSVDSRRLLQAGGLQDLIDTDD